MSKNEIKDYIKNHKKEIVIGAISVVGIGVMTAIGVKSLKTVKTIVPDVAKSIDDIDVPDTWSVGTVTQLWKENTWTNAIINDITIADLGKLGEELQKIDGVKSNTEVSAMFGLLKTVE